MQSTGTTRPSVLAALRSQLETIANHFHRSRRIVYIDYPLHLNVGDLLINLGTEAFFEALALNIWRRYSVYDCPAEIPGIRDDDVILFHGGGNLGDIWEHHQKLRERVLAAYPRNRCIILPQSVFFRSKTKEQAAVARLSRHPDLHIFVRDRTSLETLSQYPGIECSTMPDMAHFLPRLAIDSEPGSSRELTLLRRDKERATELEGAKDWSDLLPATVKLARAGLIVLAKVNRLTGSPFAMHKLWYPVRNRVIHHAVEAFSPCSTIVTDRLHAVILGLLMGKTVKAYDNSYGKLSRYASAWLTGVPGLLKISVNRP